MKDLQLLLDGYRRFYARRFGEDDSLYSELAEKGQSPKFLIIACSDSRVDPSIIFDTDPGDIFVIRNVANLVPPYGPDSGYHGTSAALEFAVKQLGVRHIIVLGHGQCAGIRALLESENPDDAPGEFIGPWVHIAKDARSRVLSSNVTNKLSACEHEAIRVSLDNLLTFPWVKERVERGDLHLHGWHFAIFDGILRTLDPTKNAFVPIHAKAA